MVGVIHLYEGNFFFFGLSYIKGVTTQTKKQTERTWIVASVLWVDNNFIDYEFESLYLC